MKHNKGKNNENDNEECEVLSSKTSIFDKNYKIIILGDSGVGKTRLILRASTGEFNSQNEPVPNLYADFNNFCLKYKNNVLKLDIWDTVGQEEYRSLIKSFFKDASLVVIVYAIDKTDTFKSIDEWIRQVKTECNPEIKIFLIGNKADLDDA